MEWHGFSPRNKWLELNEFHWFFCFTRKSVDLAKGPQVFFRRGFPGGLPSLFNKTSVIPAFWLDAPTWHFAGSEKSHPRSMAPSEPDAIATSRAGMLLSLLPVPETLGFYSQGCLVESPDKSTKTPTPTQWCFNRSNSVSHGIFVSPRLGWLVSCFLVQIFGWTNQHYSNKNGI